MHVISLIVISALAILGLVPKLAITAMLILLGRAIFYLKQGAVVPAKIVGFQEITFGLMLVGLTALGFWGSL